jgi:rod shape-determining protein MreD
MKIKKTTISFMISAVAILVGPLLLPKIHLFYFAPFMVICLYHYTRIELLWRSLLCGVIVDLLSSGSFFGMTSVNYCIVSGLLYGQTRNFFEDKLSTFPLMTFFFSFFSTLLSVFFSFFTGFEHPLSLLWIATDLIGMSVVDALFALFAFSLPFELTRLGGKISYKEENS